MNATWQTASHPACLIKEAWWNMGRQEYGLCVCCWLQRSVKARSPEFQWSRLSPPLSRSIQQLRLSCLSWRWAKPPIQMSAGSHAPLDVATDRLRCHSVSVARIAQRDWCSTGSTAGTSGSHRRVNSLESGLITPRQQQASPRSCRETIRRSSPDWTLPLSLPPGEMSRARGVGVQSWCDCVSARASHNSSLTTLPPRRWKGKKKRKKAVRNSSSVRCFHVKQRWWLRLTACSQRSSSSIRGASRDHHSWNWGAMSVGTEPPSACSRQHQCAPSVWCLRGLR